MIEVSSINRICAINYIYSRLAVMAGEALPYGLRLIAPRHMFTRARCTRAKTNHRPTGLV